MSCEGLWRGRALAVDVSVGEESLYSLFGLLRCWFHLNGLRQRDKKRTGRTWHWVEIQSETKEMLVKSYQFEDIYTHIERISLLTDKIC